MKISCLLTRWVGGSKKGQKYAYVIYEWSQLVNITLKFYEVLNVDEAKQTVTLSMHASLVWEDDRLDVNRSQEYIEKYGFRTIGRR